MSGPPAAVREVSERVRLLRRVHGHARAQGLDDAGRRALQERVTGVRSAARMSVPQLEAVVRALGGGGRSRDALPELPVTRRLRALWISAFHLGVVRRPGDAALGAWLRRQTGVDAARFADERDLGRAPAALEDWLARPVEAGGGGVDWSPYPDGARCPRGRVIEAQVRRLVGDTTGAGPDFWARDLDGRRLRVRGVTTVVFPAPGSDAVLDRVIRHLGAEVRARLADAGAAPAP